jgi:hypothetical protein
MLRWQDKHVEDVMELDNAVTAYFYSLDLTPSSPSNTRRRCAPLLGG